MTVPALKVNNASFAYGRRQVLSDVCFSLNPGEFGILLGVNGAGKTTLFSLITRLFVSARGSIEIYGHDIRQDNLRALSQLGVIFQQPTLDLDLTLLQNLKYHCALHGLSSRKMKGTMLEALESAGLAERAGDRARELSGGQRRRVELIRAFLHRPRLLLADEPTVGLDVHSRRTILEQVRERCRKDAIGVLWATHLIDEVEADDHVIVLHEGRVLARGIAKVLIEQTGAASMEEAFTRLTGRAAA